MADFEHIKNIKNLALVLFFELFHEYAYAVDDNQLQQAFEFQSGAPSPFEHIVDQTFEAEKLEELRLKNNNLKSGYSSFKRNSNMPIVRYFMDRGPNFIASFLNKLTHDFYDTPDRRSWSLPSMEYRTPENIAEAALMVADVLFAKYTYTYEYLLSQAQDKAQLEGYLGYTQVKLKLTFFSDNCSPVISSPARAPLACGTVASTGDPSSQAPRDDGRAVTFSSKNKNDEEIHQSISTVLG